MEIAFRKVSFDYQAGTPFAHTALREVTFTIPSGSFTAIIGHTGSGKSTVLQHLNGLVKPTAGEVRVGDTVLTADSDMKGLKSLRQQVGIVFQFPEAQLFDETIGQDIAFGPKNFGVSEADALALAHEKLKEVGLPDTFFDRSPFELSGGQKRRVAIAGVLALEPKVLVLDEPTAGLDPRGAKEMMALFQRLHQEKGMTIVLVTHQMEYVAAFADHVIVLEKGRVDKEGSPKAIFSDVVWLKEKQLSLPWAGAFDRQLRAGDPSCQGRKVGLSIRSKEELSGKLESVATPERANEGTEESDQRADVMDLALTIDELADRLIDWLGKGGEGQRG